MINLILVTFGKLIAAISCFLNLGGGSTWPGHIALSLNKDFIKIALHKNSHLKAILIAGTNGKTTTGKLIQTILEKNEKEVFQNRLGANLLNGIASSLIMNSDFLGRIKANYAIFEVDENTLPLALKEIIPDTLILLNLFRDQLDRYGEVNTIAKKWGEAIQNLPKKTTLILNADDPQIAYFGNNREALYFGLEDKIGQTMKRYAADTTYCLNCNTKLVFERIYFSHLGIWRCPSCKKSRPRPTITSFSTYPLLGTYNKYNTLAAVLFAKKIGMNDADIYAALKTFKPAFGRQEKIIIDGKKAQVFLSKNPTSFNESLRTINNLGAKNLLLVLNDRIPDGRDVSWIWDVNTEEFLERIENIVVSGDRTHDMALRIKYSSSSEFQIEEKLKTAIKIALEQTSKTETLYILPTYSAMLEVRKILSGRKIP